MPGSKKEVVSARDICTPSFIPQVYNDRINDGGTNIADVIHTPMGYNKRGTNNVGHMADVMRTPFPFEAKKRKETQRDAKRPARQFERFSKSAVHVSSLMNDENTRDWRAETPTEGECNRKKRK